MPDTGACLQRLCLSLLTCIFLFPAPGWPKVSGCPEHRLWASSQTHSNGDKRPLPDTSSTVSQVSLLKELFSGVSQPQEVTNTLCHHCHSPLTVCNYSNTIANAFDKSGALRDMENEAGTF